MAAVKYFQRLSAFFPAEIPFTQRTRRPPKDAANALLSWTYTIVRSEVDVALRTQGLDPALGWLHELSSGRPALSLDLLEPLRAPVCDLLTLNLLNHKTLQAEHSRTDLDNGGTYLTEAGRKKFLSIMKPTCNANSKWAKAKPIRTFAK